MLCWYGCWWLCVLQGISAVENMLGRPNVLNHLSIPAACFTHPEVSFVGVTQDKAEEMAKEQGFKLGVAKTSFKANSKVRAATQRCTRATSTVQKHRDIWGWLLQYVLAVE